MNRHNYLHLVIGVKINVPGPSLPLKEANLGRVSGVFLALLQLYKDYCMLKNFPFPSSIAK